jgi:hypothetical protein
VFIAMARRWWPLPVAVATSLLVQTIVYTSRYDVSGHATGHLSSGTFVLLATVVAGVLLWTTSAGRRSPVVLVGLATWLGAGIAIAIGNARVIDALIDTGQANTPTGSVIDTTAVSDAHWLADTAPFVAVAGAFVIVLGLYRVRAASVGLTSAAAVLNVLVPPWIVPGFGVMVLAGARVIATEKAARSAGSAAGRGVGRQDARRDVPGRRASERAPRM